MVFNFQHNHPLSIRHVWCFWNYPHIYVIDRRNSRGAGIGRIVEKLSGTASSLFCRNFSILRHEFHHALELSSFIRTFHLSVFIKYVKASNLISSGKNNSQSKWKYFLREGNWLCVTDLKFFVFDSFQLNYK